MCVPSAATRSPERLEPGRFYPIYKGSNNREDLLREERNYPFFLSLYAQHIEPVAETYAYCLLRNHFHVLVRIRDIGDTTRSPSQSFSNLFNAYARAFNKTYSRSGALFERPFSRTEISNGNYFANLIYYIHFNPQKHAFVQDYREWTYSSYHALATTRATHLQRQSVLEWFGGKQGFIQSHTTGMSLHDIQSLTADDFDV